MSAVPIVTKGFGTMSMTLTATPQPFEKSIATLKYVYDKFGVKFFNGGLFYHIHPDKTNMMLLQQFVEEVKDDDLVISIKGGLGHDMVPDGSAKLIKESVEQCVKFLKSGSTKPKVLYEMARVDPKTPYEETIGYIYDHVKSGEIDGISLSEVGPESIKKAASVAPISAIEVELSLFSQDILNNGILAEASKHNIPIIAYSPLARGILTDHAAEHPDFIGSLGEGDFRKAFHLDRFTPEIFDANKKRLQALYDFAHKKGVSLEGLAMSYCESLSGLEDFAGIPKVSQIIPIPSGSTKEKNERNFSTIKLSRADIDEIQEIIANTEVKGLRYNAMVEGMLNG